MSASQAATDWATFALLVNLKVFLVLALACLAAWAMGARPAAERHLLWLMAIGGVLLLPLLERSSSPFPSRAEASAGSGVLPRGGDTPAAGQFDGAHEPMQNASALATSAPSTPWPALRIAVPGLAAGERAWPIHGAALLVLLWTAGSALLALRFALGLVHLAIVSRRARPLREASLVGKAGRIAAELGIARPVRLLEGGVGAMPISFGVTRPSLLLPSDAKGWPDARQEHVLRHELAHLLRRDSLVELLIDLGCVLYWLNPLIWVAARRIRAEREHACDDIVLLSGARPSGYAGDLLAVARNARRRWVPRAAGIAMAGASKLESRVVAVLDERSRADRVSGKPLATIGAGMSLAIVLLSAVALVSAPARAAGPLAAVRSAGGPEPLAAPLAGELAGSRILVPAEAGKPVRVAPVIEPAAEPVAPTAAPRVAAAASDTSSTASAVQPSHAWRSALLRQSQSGERCMNAFTTLWAANRAGVEAAMRAAAEDPGRRALVLLDDSIATPAELREFRSLGLEARDALLDHVVVVRKETAERLAGATLPAGVVCYVRKTAASPPGARG